MTEPYNEAWLVLKELQGAFQDDPNSEEMRHQQNMQNMLDTYTPRGNTNPKYIQQNAGAKPVPFWGEEYYKLNPWTESADLNFQAENSRNPADARMFAQMAEEADARYQPAQPAQPEEEMAGLSDEFDFEELKQFLEEAARRRVAPLSYRRKIKPLSDQEVARDLRNIRNYRR